MHAAFAPKMSLVAMALLLVLGPGWAWTRDDEAATKDRFLKTYPAALKALQARFAKAFGSVTGTQEHGIGGPNHIRIDSRFSFAARMPDLAFIKDQMTTGLYSYLHAPFSLGGPSMSSLIANGGAVIQRVASVRRGDQTLMKIEFDFKKGANKRLRKLAGWVLVAPIRNGCCTNTSSQIPPTCGAGTSSTLSRRTDSRSRSALLPRGQLQASGNRPISIAMSSTRFTSAMCPTGNLSSPHSAFPTLAAHRDAGWRHRAIFVKPPLQVGKPGFSYQVQTASLEHIPCLTAIQRKFMLSEPPLQRLRHDGPDRGHCAGDLGREPCRWDHGRAVHGNVPHSPGP